MALLWSILNPTAVIGIAVVTGAIFLFTRLWRLGRALAGTAAIALLALVALPVGDWLVAPLERRFAVPEVLPDNVAGIIVLGGAIDTRQTGLIGQVSLNARGERIVAFVDLARRYPLARLVYTGGSAPTSDAEKSEAELALPLLLLLGVPRERIALETRSQSTSENAAFSRDIVKPKAGERWILVTSALHMPRAVGAFRRAGWTVLPFPVDHRQGGNEGGNGFSLSARLGLIDAASREWASLILYYFQDKTDRVLPAR